MKRIVPGLFIAGFWLLLVLYGPGLLFSTVVAVVVLIAADEYARMVDSRHLPPVERWVVNLLLAGPVLAVALFPRPEVLPWALLLTFLAMTGYFLFRYKELSDSFTLFCRLVFGTVYIGFLGAHVLLLRELPEGASWLIIATAITAGSDSAAYFVGRACGRRKLCPNISPNKTVEGALAGIAAGVVTAAFFALLLLDEVHWPLLIFSAIFLGLIGIAGDLTESIIKRGTGTKDSGSCLAGHGGILDRADSLLFVCPVLYYLLHFSVS
ncbi:MAG: phosphatidate cytidylyltransferase [Desulforhopalus sp.]|jgi:phosphatidate cytidylyltransferase|nr:phosphatidate cytidylyltransferase [Desulforhopalus sp.]